MTLWTVACQDPLSMGFSRQEYWSGLPCHPPRDLPDPGLEPMSLMSPALVGNFFNTSSIWEAQLIHSNSNNINNKNNTCYVLHIYHLLSIYISYLIPISISYVGVVIYINNQDKDSEKLITWSRSHLLTNRDGI